MWNFNHLRSKTHLLHSGHKVMIDEDLALVYGVTPND